MKLGIYFSENDVHVLIIAKTGCSRDLFSVIHTPIGRFERKKVITMSKRTKSFTEYDIIKVRREVNYGFEVNKEYQKRLEQLINAGLSIAEYMDKTNALCLEFQKKYAF